MLLSQLLVLKASSIAWGRFRDHPYSYVISMRIPHQNLAIVMSVSMFRTYGNAYDTLQTTFVARPSFESYMRVGRDGCGTMESTRAPSRRCYLGLGQHGAHVAAVPVQVPPLRARGAPRHAHGAPPQHPREQVLYCTILRCLLKMPEKGTPG